MVGKEIVETFDGRLVVTQIVVEFGVFEIFFVEAVDNVRRHFFDFRRIFGIGITVEKQFAFFEHFFAVGQIAVIFGREFVVASHHIVVGFFGLAALGEELGKSLELESGGKVLFQMEKGNGIHIFQPLVLRRSTDGFLREFEKACGPGIFLLLEIFFGQMILMHRMFDVVEGFLVFAASDQQRQEQTQNQVFSHIVI